MHTNRIDVGCADLTFRFIVLALMAVGCAPSSPVTASSIPDAALSIDAGDSGSTSDAGLADAGSDGGCPQGICTGHDSGSVGDAGVDSDAGCLGGTCVAGLIFFDDFETGDLSRSTNGFAWADSAYARVTKQNPHVGAHSLAFEYSSTVDSESWSEQRFVIGQNLTEVWIAYDLWVPANYFHRDTLPSSLNWWGGGEKEFVLYADEYSGANPTLILGRNFKRRDSGSWVNDGSSWMNSSYRYIDPQGTQAWYQMGPDDTPMLIDIAHDVGTWQKRILHVKQPTSALSNDGVVEYWMRPATGATRKCIDRHDGSFYGANAGRSQNYFNKGYLLGSANSGFSQPTTFFVDNFEVRTDNVWGVQ